MEENVSGCFFFWTVDTRPANYTLLIHTRATTHSIHAINSHSITTVHAQTSCHQLVFSYSAYNQLIQFMLLKTANITYDKLFSFSQKPKLQTATTKLQLIITSTVDSDVYLRICISRPSLLHFNLCYSWVLCWYMIWTTPAFKQW